MKILSSSLPSSPLYRNLLLRVFLHKTQKLKGVVEDLMVRGNLRAAVDLGTMKAYARLGFRTEQLSPFNIVEGLTLREKFPLDGNNGHVKLEIKANVAFPQPEIKYSTENRGSFVGMGVSLMKPCCICFCVSSMV